MNALEAAFVSTVLRSFYSGYLQNIPIYMHVRLLVAMYLFMTGYGHFSYFWNRGDFSFRRVLNVGCLLMKTDEICYQHDIYRPGRIRLK